MLGFAVLLVGGVLYSYGNMAQVGFINSTTCNFKKVEIKGNNTTRVFQNIKPNQYHDAIPMWCLWNTKIEIEVTLDNNETYQVDYNIRNRYAGSYYNKCKFFTADTAKINICNTQSIQTYIGELYDF